MPNKCCCPLVLDMWGIETSLLSWRRMYSDIPDLVETFKRMEKMEWNKAVLDENDFKTIFEQVTTN